MLGVARDPSVLAPWLEERRRRGLDRRDEVWEGVLHMVPLPAFEHDELVLALGAALRQVIVRHELGRLGNTNIREPGSGDQNYRGPDLIFIKKEASVTRFAEGSHAWIEHGPDFLVEVLSPGDESAKKLTFYAERGVPEILFVDGLTARPEVLRLVAGSYLVAAPDSERGLSIECLGARLFYEPRPEGRGVLTLKDDRTGETVPVI